MIKQVLTKAVGTAYVAARLRSERRVPYLPFEEVRRRRDANIQRLVRYAAATMPHYRELFRMQGLDPRRIRSAADLDWLPLLNKAAVRSDPARFVAQSARGRRAVPFVTSGTTGTPLVVHHDPLSLLANLAHTEPEKEVTREIVGRGKSIRQLSILYSQTTVKKIQGFYSQAAFVPARPNQRRINIELPLDEVLEAIRSFRPQVLASYGSYIETLFRMVDAGAIHFPLPQAVRYGGDGMSEPGRRLIEERFGIPVLSNYNAVECLRIGFMCGHGRGFHLREDLCDLKLVNARGERVPPGEQGEVVISNLVNRGTVLLNYRLGDLAVLADEPCPCGRSLPLLGGLEGRIEDVLLLPGNRVLHPRAVWGLLKDRREILRYQLIQHEPTRFECRLLTRDRAAFDQLVDELKDDFERLLGPVRIEFDFSEGLEAPAGSKFRPVVSRCGLAAL